MPPKPEVVLTRPIREALELRVRSRSSRADDARKARLILMLADGETFDAIVEGLGCSPTYVSRWKKRFLEDSLAGLHSRHLGKVAKVLTPRMEGRILAATRRKPADGSTHWTTRKLAKHLGVSHMLVHRVWARAGIKPQSIRRYMLSDDPDFETVARKPAAYENHISIDSAHTLPAKGEVVDSERNSVASMGFCHNNRKYKGRL